MTARETMIRHWHLRNGHSPDPGYKTCLGCAHEIDDMIAALAADGVEMIQWRSVEDPRLVKDWSLLIGYADVVSIGKYSDDGRALWQMDDGGFNKLMVFDRWAILPMGLK